MTKFPSVAENILKLMKERKLDPAAAAIIDKTDTVNITAEHKKREFVDIVLLSGCNRKVNFK